MYDATDDVEHLQRGLRHEGDRRPSEILEAIQGDLEWVSMRAMEWGHEPYECYALPLKAEAYLALTKSSQNWDILMDTDTDALIDEGDVQTHVFHLLIQDLLEILNDHTLPCQKYGWQSEDPEEDGYEKLGVWVDWDYIDACLEKGRIIEIDHVDEIMDAEYVATLKENGAEFALLSGDGFAELYHLTTSELIWEVS